MWILEWGDSTNQSSGQWNHEEHDSSDKAFDAAKTKIGMGLVAHAIHSDRRGPLDEPRRVAGCRWSR
jgi:hypothetical protein